MYVYIYYVYIMYVYIYMYYTQNILPCSEPWSPINGHTISPSPSLVAIGHGHAAGAGESIRAGSDQCGECLKFLRVSD